MKMYQANGQLIWFGKYSLVVWFDDIPIMGVLLFRIFQIFHHFVDIHIHITKMISSILCDSILNSQLLNVFVPFISFERG